MNFLRMSLSYRSIFEMRLIAIRISKMCYTLICARDGSGNPTLLGVDCSEQPDRV
jgi:hypothetical protein